MESRAILEETIKRPVRTAGDAELVREAATILAELLRVEARARELVERDAPGSTSRTDLRGMTLHDAAARVLEEAGVPLHVRELGARIKSGGWRHPRSTNAQPQQILFQLAARLPRYTDRFRRVAPNTFGLTSWDREPPTRRSRRPRTGLFRGRATGVGREIGERDPAAAEDASWRSS